MLLKSESELELNGVLRCSVSSATHQLCTQTSHSIQSLGPPIYKVSGGLPSASEGKEPACNAGDLGSIPGSGRSPGEGNSNPLQYFCLEKIYGQRSLVDNSP